MFTSYKKSVRIILSLLLIVVILSGFILLTGFQGRDLRFVALDVGQGDAILIRTPYQQNILVDGGPDNSVIYRLSKNLPFYDRTIDLMILTHPDADHVTGLVEVLRRYKVKEVLSNGVSYNSPSYLEWQKLIKEENIPLQIAQAGQVIDFGENLKLDILYPEKSYLNQTVEETNLTSVVAKLVYKNTSFLLTGDAPIEVEDELISKGVDFKADVLKVSHHGSKASTSQEFVKAVSPKYAVISVGRDNKFGHPTLRAITNLQRELAEILRTDELGNIVLVSDGENIKKD